MTRSVGRAFNRWAPPPNTRVQRTRSSASPPRSPLTRNPLGGVGQLLLSAVVLVLAPQLAVAQKGGSEDLEFLKGAVLTVERSRPSKEPPRIYDFVPVTLTPKQVKAVKTVLVRASRRTEAEERSGKAVGAPGCVTESYRLTFQTEHKRAVALIHLCGDGWMQASAPLQNIVFLGEERFQLEAILAVAPIVAPGGAHQ